MIESSIARNDTGSSVRWAVSIMELRDGKVVRETQYFADPFAAPDWRSQRVQRIA